MKRRIYLFIASCTFFLGAAALSLPSLLSTGKGSWLMSALLSRALKQDVIVDEAVFSLSGPQRIGRLELKPATGASRPGDSEEGFALQANDLLVEGGFYGLLLKGLRGDVSDLPDLRCHSALLAISNSYRADIANFAITNESEELLSIRGVLADKGPRGGFEFFVDKSTLHHLIPIGYGELDNFPTGLIDLFFKLHGDNKVSKWLGPTLTLKLHLSSPQATEGKGELLTMTLQAQHGQGEFTLTRTEQALHLKGTLAAPIPNILQGVAEQLDLKVGEKVLFNADLFVPQHAWLRDGAADLITLLDMSWGSLLLQSAPQQTPLFAFRRPALAKPYSWQLQAGPHSSSGSFRLEQNKLFIVGDFKSRDIDVNGLKATIDFDGEHATFAPLHIAFSPTLLRSYLPKTLSLGSKERISLQIAQADFAFNDLLWRQPVEMLLKGELRGIALIPRCTICLSNGLCQQFESLNIPFSLDGGKAHAQMQAYLATPSKLRPVLFNVELELNHGLTPLPFQTTIALEESAELFVVGSWLGGSLLQIEDSSKLSIKDIAFAKDLAPQLSGWLQQRKLPIVNISLTATPGAGVWDIEQPLSAALKNGVDVHGSYEGLVASDNHRHPWSLFTFSLHPAPQADTYSFEAVTRSRNGVSRLELQGKGGLRSGHVSWDSLGDMTAQLHGKDVPLDLVPALPANVATAFGTIHSVDGSLAYRADDPRAPWKVALTLQGDHLSLHGDIMLDGTLMPVGHDNRIALTGQLTPQSIDQMAVMKEGVAFEKPVAFTLKLDQFSWPLGNNSSADLDVGPLLLVNKRSQQRWDLGTSTGAVRYLAADGHYAFTLKNNKAVNALNLEGNFQPTPAGAPGLTGALDAVAEMTLQMNAVDPALALAFLPTPPQGLKWDGALQSPLGLTLSWRQAQTAPVLEAALTSDELSLQLQGQYANGGLLLTHPLRLTLYLTPRLSKALLGQVSSLLSGIYSVDGAPLQLTLAPGSFFPIATPAVSAVRIQNGALQPPPLSLDGALSLKRFISLAIPLDDKAPLTVAATPLYFSIDRGIIYLHRFDFLLADSYPFALWGTMNLIREWGDLILGITPRTMAQAFDVKGLAPEQVLQLSIRGPLGSMSIDTSQMAFKVTNLLLQGGSGIHNMILGSLMQLAQGPQQPVPPPTTQPLPWETSGPQQEESAWEAPQKIIERPAKALDQFIEKNAKGLLRNILQ